MTKIGMSSKYDWNSEKNDDSNDISLFQWKDSVCSDQEDASEATGSIFNMHLENSEIENGSRTTVRPNRLSHPNKKNKKDDFDYDTFIHNELVRQKKDHLNGEERRRMIQKIRNRKSAERSRLRQKGEQAKLEEVNNRLENEIQLLRRQLDEALAQNSLLASKIKAVIMPTQSSEEMSTLMSVEEMPVRVSPAQTIHSLKNVLLVVFAVIAFAVMPDDTGSSGGVMIESGVKMSGIMPFLSKRRDISVPVSPIESICPRYCEAHFQPTPSNIFTLDRSAENIRSGLDSNDSGLPFKNSSNLNSLICFDPKFEKGQKPTFKVFVDDETLGCLDTKSFYFGEFSKLKSSTPKQ